MKEIGFLVVSGLEQKVVMKKHSTVNVQTIVRSPTESRHEKTFNLEHTDHCQVSNMNKCMLTLPLTKCTDFHQVIAHAEKVTQLLAQRSQHRLRHALVALPQTEI